MVKSIFYLDEAKMYSMSSQIFEGITEYILKERSTSTEESGEQKGPVGSGRVLADAMRLGERSIEKRFLHDHSLSLFEMRLNELSMMDHVDVPVEGESSLTGRSFVRVNARASFIDAAKITSMLASFNEVGEALAHVTNYSAIEAVRTQIQALQDSQGDKSGLAKLKKTESAMSDTAALAKKGGLYQDPKFLKHLARVTEFGYSDQLEIQQSVGSSLFSACLKRQCLRESEDLIIRKYSRRTEKKLVVLGVVTQSESVADAGVEAATGSTMKQAIRTLVNHIAVIEGSLSGKAPNEIVLDPIAVYATV